MEHLVLIFACINGTGCSETFQTYKYYNATTVNLVESKALEYKKIVPVILSDYILPLSAASAGATAVFKLNKYTNIGVNRDNLSLNYNFSF